MTYYLSRRLRAVAFMAVTLMALPIQNALGAVPTDLFMSEYIEGSGFSKAIEIYNGTGAPVDLAAGTYSLELYSNGSASPSQTAALSGTIADGDVYVLAHPSADSAVLAQADITDGSVINFNGDDGVVLKRDDVVIDAFGQNAVDPGSQWPGGGANDTLRRKATVCSGDTSFADAFDVSVEWDVFAQNTFDNLGSYTASCDGAESAPSVSSTTPASGETRVVIGSNIDVNFSEDVNATGSWYDISCSISGAHTATVSGGPSSYTIDPDTDFSVSESCTVTIFAAQITDVDSDDPPDEMSEDYIFTFDVSILASSDVKIHEIQGSASASPLVGYTVAIEGIVVGDFQDDVGEHGDMNGFFVQEEDADADADALTSEGIFVYNGSNPILDVAQGDLVTVEGPVSEFSSMTQLSSFSGVTVVSSGNPLPTASNITLPLTAVSDLESMEGMRVTLPQDLNIVEYFNFDRFGEIVLAGERLIQPTAIFEPSADPLSDRALLADFNSRNRITLDDGRTASNPDPAIHPNGAEFNLDNLFRGGDLVTDTTGVLNYAFGLYRVQPTQGAVYTSANPRTAEPDPVGGGLKFASFNVLNYFSTLDGSGPICGPAEDQYCRGADNQDEFTRQRDKIISAINALGADVVGLIEIENHVDDAAVLDLVAGLNDASAPDTWDYVDVPPIGTDVIKVAFIFKPESVSEVGSPAILDSWVDPRFDDQRNRPALAQTFLDTSNGAVFTLVINHFKSKGSNCDAVGDPDLNDGSGNCNLTRTSAAEAMVDWLATDPTGSNDADIIILGDLNSYDKEGPIDVFTDASYTDMAAIYGGELAYGYVFSGAVGYLDYALASPGLLAQITGVTDWHINSDEPDALDYDTSFKKDAQDAIYAPDAYRSSDHDPVIGGADLLQYDFGGFQRPLKAEPALHEAKAGQAIPMKFMLNGDYGIDILAPGYPLSQEIDCGDLSVLGDSEATMSDGDIGLTYDAEEDQYKYVWKTSKDYVGSCRQFVMQLTDGGIHYANIKFK